MLEPLLRVSVPACQLTIVTPEHPERELLLTLGWQAHTLGVVGVVGHGVDHRRGGGRRTGARSSPLYRSGGGRSSRGRRQPSRRSARLASSAVHIAITRSEDELVLPGVAETAPSGRMLSRCLRPRLERTVTTVLSASSNRRGRLVRNCAASLAASIMRERTCSAGTTETSSPSAFSYALGSGRGSPTTFALGPERRDHDAGGEDRQRGCGHVVAHGLR